MAIETIRWEGGLPGHVRMIEQTLLPGTGGAAGQPAEDQDHEVLLVRDEEAMFDGIRRLAVRGAPAIGVAAAYGLMLAVQNAGDRAPDDFVKHVEERADYLAGARPTAVNLFWALERMVERTKSARAEGQDTAAMLETLLAEAHEICTGDQETCRRMGEIGAELIADGATVLTHCNAGALATAGMGTALAPIYQAAQSGKRVAVFADETRPLLQGARLTAWELMHEGIDVTLITDSMAARVMFEGKIDAVFVGSRSHRAQRRRLQQDRDLLGRPSPPRSTACRSTSSPPCRPSTGAWRAAMRSRSRSAPPEEITEGFGKRTAPAGVKVYNPRLRRDPRRTWSRGSSTEVGLIERPDDREGRGPPSPGAVSSSRADWVPWARARAPAGARGARLRPPRPPRRGLGAPERPSPRPPFPAPGASPREGVSQVRSAPRGCGPARRARRAHATQSVRFQNAGGGGRCHRRIAAGARVAPRQPPAPQRDRPPMSAQAQEDHLQEDVEEPRGQHRRRGGDAAARRDERRGDELHHGHRRLQAQA